MNIKKLHLENFRSYHNLTLDFPKEKLTSLLVGGNAQGKTNILESISLLSFPKSFRTLHQEELIKNGEDYFRVQGEIILKTDEEKITQEVFFSKKPKKEKILKQSDLKKSVQDFIGAFLTVLFSPETMNLFTLGPAIRRRFLNILLSQIDADYLQNLIDYQKALKSRNALLKKYGTKMEFDFWNDILGKTGSNIIVKRLEMLKKIGKKLPIFYGDIAGKEQKLEIVYEKRGPTNAAEYSKKLKETWEHDLIFKSTSTGPHRDNFTILLDGKDIREHGSRGEIRSTVLALKLAEMEIIEETTGEKPILLLDDVFSELDDSRQHHLIDRLQTHQTIMTSTILPEWIKNRRHVAIFQVEKSQVQLG